MAAPLPVYTHVEAAAESVFGAGGSVLAAAAGASAPGTYVKGAVVVVHAQGGLVTAFDAAPAVPRPTPSPGDISTAYATPIPAAVSQALEGVGLPEGWDTLPPNLLHTEDGTTLSTPVSALVAQALADALVRTGGTEGSAAGAVHPLDMGVWAQEASVGGLALRAPLPRLWTLGGAGAAALQGAGSSLPPLPGTAPEAEALAKAPPAVDPTVDVSFAVVAAHRLSSPAQ